MDPILSPNCEAGNRSSSKGIEQDAPDIAEEIFLNVKGNSESKLREQ